MDPFLGQILLFAGNFAPRGWALCEGQLLPINSNQALYSLYGTTYGGDGRTTFALPDLRGRAPISEGTGPGLTPRALGSRSGTEYNTITVAQMPPHSHNLSISVSSAGPDESSPGHLAGATIYRETSGTSNNYPDINVTHQGGGQPVYNRQPFLAINYIVAIQGTFPSRN